MPVLVHSTKMSQIKKMKDAYYPETSLCDTGSVIIIVFIQLRGIPTYLLYISLKIVSAVVR